MKHRGRVERTRTQITTTKLAAWGLALALVGCHGVIDPGPNANPGEGPPLPGSGPNGSNVPGGPNGANNGNGPNGPSGSDDPGDEPGDPRIAQRIWRLTPAQFNSEVKRVLGDGAPEVTIPESAGEDGLTNIAENAVVDLGNAGIFADGARAIATWAVGQGVAVSRCTSNHGTDACIDTVLGWLPARAFRRTVDDSERQELRALYDDLRGDYPFDYAYGGVIRAVLLAPDFLYRTELGEGGVLEPSEIANLLAFSITDAAPDDPLLQAVEQADLTDPDEREAQARRLMSKSAPVWQRFFWEWLSMSTLYSQGEEVGLDATLIAQMEEEYRAFVREVVVNEKGTLRDVLSAPYTWAQPELAEFYGADHPGSGLQRVQLNPAQRGGILTQGAWLVAHGKRGRDNVVRRGMNIFKQAMCNDISPPAGVDVQAELRKLVGPDATVREIVEARGSASSCGGCHRIPDPVGMVFENYGSDGAWQTVDVAGQPVDSRVDVMGVGTFDNAHAFATALADDMRFQSCFVQRFTQFMVGIDLGRPDMVLWTQQALESLVENDTSLEELVVSIVRHPAFIERRTEVGP